MYGGASPEHDVSCNSAKAIIDNIDKSKYILHCVEITQNNIWMEENKPIENIIDYIRGFDVVFSIIHGTDGEDGKLQGLLDFFKIKYVGPRCCESALCMDKVYSKIVFEKLGIPVIPYQVINDKSELKIPYPVIVKPANGGSSIGITKANNDEELEFAITTAKKYDNKVLVEKFVKAQELECAVLENQDIIVSEVGEIKSANEFYDYNAKYENNKSETIIPADISEEIKEQIQTISGNIFKSLNLNGLSRIDFLYDTENSQLYLNEINTLPGFTPISMYPKLIIDKGYTYQELISILVENAK